MKVKEKICGGCGLPKVIWKNKSINGKQVKLCKTCSAKDIKVCHGTEELGKVKQSFIKPRSEKRSKEDLIYQGKRLIFLKEHPMCQANIPGICTGKSGEVHHKSGKIGSNYLDTSTWLAVDRTCHQWIELHPVEAKELGFSNNRL